MGGRSVISHSEISGNVYKCTLWLVYVVIPFVKPGGKDEPVEIQD